MTKIAYILFLFIAYSTITKAQITVSGPMQGHTTDNTANIWLMVKQKNNPLRFKILNRPDATIQVTNSCHMKWCTYNLKIDGISSGLNQLEISAGSKRQQYEFNGPDEIDHSSYSFLLGSCTFRWGPFQILAPGNGYRIFKPMSKIDSDLMLWMGDNVYYLFRDHENEARMFRENAKSRRKKAMSAFIQDRQHYAIWDDHDYGPNNSLGSYEKKEISKKVFDDFWANPSDKSDGTYYSFQYGSSEFFMLDSRWYRTDPDNQPNSLLGQEQLQWLIQGLQDSKATFKFVTLGSQMINPEGTHHERFASYTEEYNTLLSAASKIENVVFLSGDMHYSTAFKNEDFDRPLYEFSASPLTAFRYKIKKKSDEYENPYFVEGTQYHRQNFGKVTIAGDQCTFEVFDKKGKLVWSFTIP